MHRQLRFFIASHCISYILYWYLYTVRTNLRRKNIKCPNQKSSEKSTSSTAHSFFHNGNVRLWNQSTAFIFVSSALLKIFPFNECLCWLFCCHIEECSFFRQPLIMCECCRFSSLSLALHCTALFQCKNGWQCVFFHSYVLISFRYVSIWIGF